MSEDMHRPVTTAELVAALRTVKCCSPEAGVSECKTLSAIQRLLRRVEGDAPVEVGDARITAAEERGRRRGVEQCRDLVRSWAPSHPNTPVLIGFAFAQLGTLLGLAPRDPAPQPMEGAPCSECGGVFGTHSSWCHRWATATNNPNRREPRSSAPDSSMEGTAMPKGGGKASPSPRDSAPGTIGGTMTDEEARRRSTFDAQLAEVGCEPLASAHVRCNCYARIQGARVAHARTCPMWTATIALDIEATLACSRDAERILGERLKEAREILADCRRFIASADLLRRIDASISQGDRK